MPKGANNVVKANLGRNIKELRLSLNMSQAKLAEKSKTDQAFISEMERGIRSHGPGGHDDAANVAAGAMVLATAMKLDVVPLTPPIIISGGPRNVPGSDTAATSQSYSEPATTNATTAYFEWIANGGGRGWGPV
jgi:transcriptional regulator with XRE-family HTH domain